MKKLIILFLAISSLSWGQNQRTRDLQEQATYNSGYWVVVDDNGFPRARKMSLNTLTGNERALRYVAQDSVKVYVGLESNFTFAGLPTSTYLTQAQFTSAGYLRSIANGLLLLDEAVSGIFDGNCHNYTADTVFSCTGTVTFTDRIKVDTSLSVGVNTVTGFQSGAIGLGNVVSGDRSGAVGGRGNSITDSASFIGGGSLNSVSGYRSGIVGGSFDTITSNYSFIGGGLTCKITGTYSAALGSVSSSITNSFSFLGPGSENSITSQYGVILGGGLNTVSGTNSAIICASNKNLSANNTVLVPNLVVDNSLQLTPLSNTAGGNVNVAGRSLLYVQDNLSNVTIQGFVGGVNGQILHIVFDSQGDNLILKHDSGTATQKIYTNTGADITIDSNGGGATLIYTTAREGWTVIGVAL